MQTKRHSLHWEPGALLVLFLLFLFGVYRVERVAQETESQDQPSSLATSKPGTGALYQLLESLGYHTTRLTKPWSGLDSTLSLLIVIEPLSRDVVPEEIDPLHHWIEQGGTLLYIPSKQGRSENTQDTVAGDLALVNVLSDTSHLAPALTGSPYTTRVATIAASSVLRIAPASNSHYEVLFRDKQGILAVHKTLGKGNVLVVTNDQLATNAGIQSDDNSVLLVDIVNTATHAGGSVAFDEYHHGVGFETDVEGASQSLLASMPFALRLTLLDLSMFGLLLVYIGNRRSRPIRHIPQIEFRPTADYVNSMARLYRRAGATDLALNAIYQQFFRDLCRQLNVRPGLTPDQLVPMIQSQYHVDGQSILALMLRCEQIVAGMRVSENELINLSSRIDQLRRDFGIVRLQ